MLMDVGMAMPKTAPTIGIGMAGCRQDMSYKDYTSNLIPTSLFNTWHHSADYAMRLPGEIEAKKRCMDKVTCVVFAW